MLGLKIIRTKNCVKASEYKKLEQRNDELQSELNKAREEAEKERKDCECLRLQLNEEIRRRNRCADEIIALKNDIKILRKEISAIQQQFKDKNK